MEGELGGSSLSTRLNEGERRLRRSQRTHYCLPDRLHAGDFKSKPPDSKQNGIANEQLLPDRPRGHSVRLTGVRRRSDAAA